MMHDGQHRRPGLVPAGRTYFGILLVSRIVLPFKDYSRCLPFANSEPYRGHPDNRLDQAFFAVADLVNLRALHDWVDGVREEPQKRP